MTEGSGMAPSPSGALFLDDDPFSFAPSTSSSSRHSSSVTDIRPPSVPSPTLAPASQGPSAKKDVTALMSKLMQQHGLSAEEARQFKTYNGFLKWQKERQADQEPIIGAPGTGGLKDDGPYAAEIREAHRRKDMAEVAFYDRLRREAMAKGGAAPARSSGARAQPSVGQSGKDSGLDRQEVQDILSGAAILGFSFTVNQAHQARRRCSGMEACIDWILANEKASLEPLPSRSPAPPPQTASRPSQPPAPSMTPLPQHLDAHPSGDCIRAVQQAGFSVDQALNALDRGHTEPDRCVAWILDNHDASMAARPQPTNMPAGGGEREAELCLALMQQGLAWREAHSQAIEAFRRTTSPDVAMQMALGVLEAAPEATVYDRVSMEETKASDTFLVECRRHHRFAIDTIYDGVRFHLSEGRVPCCPQANDGGEEGCAYTLSQTEIEQVLNLHFNGGTEPSPDDVKVMGLLKEANGKWYSDRARRLIFRLGCVSAGCVMCPVPECNTPVEPPAGAHAEPTQVDCPTCNHKYCSVCQRPYHYRSACEDQVTLQRLWVDWQTTGHEAYLRRMAAEDEQYRTALGEFERAQASHQEKVAGVTRAWEETVATENAKARTCRVCPTCARAIEKNDGCDAMVCGRDAHGTGPVNGCGARFSWNAARPYQPDVGRREEVPDFNTAAPERAALCRHMVDAETPHPCSECGEGIVGPMAECLQCPTEFRCIRCQGKPHDPGHYFRLHMTPMHH